MIYLVLMKTKKKTMNNKIEKIVDGIMLGIGIVVGIIVVSTCLVIVTAFVESVLTLF
jgi:hypothetical protein